MALNKVMKLWTVVITAFLALFTALGLITTTDAAAVPQTQPDRNSAVAHPEPPAMSHGLWSYARSLPPTMKQRIRAEAHGKTPSCRPRSLAATDTPADTDSDSDTAEPAAAGCA
ncbi:DUF6344 domain-containing protein [Streptomyces canus]|uniref:DUF6344 domain-containing protein n=1 Tax=Streptomyces canus TaxID=58343 RepID=UPI002789B4AB|nr:DUF6344 domain-containing protein [Streptomyces canus]MDQ0762273.1 hypothetical protein [Streptomyces canus]MDQ1069288.1 hypothetical protein [Streptomyces canus]